MKYAVLSLLLLPALAQAADVGGMADVFYVPSSKLAADVAADSGTDARDTGDGFGVKGDVRFGPAAVLAEYQSTSYGDLDADLDQMRLGVGYLTGAGSGPILEYIKADIDTTDTDGFGLHYRISGDVGGSVKLHGQLGYIMLDDDDEDLNGFEYALGVAWSFAPMVGAFLDYRVTDVEYENVDFRVAFSDVRVGARLSF